MFRHLQGDDCAPHCGAGHCRGAGEPRRDIPDGYNDNDNDNDSDSDNDDDDDIPDSDIHCEVTGSSGQRGWEIRGSPPVLDSI